MSTWQKKQANRIVRNLKIAEQRLFDLTSELQHLARERPAVIDWWVIREQIKSVFNAVGVVEDLVVNAAHRSEDEQASATSE